MIIPAAILITVYGIYVLRLAVNFGPNNLVVKSNASPVSIVVAARNEASNIESLLKSIYLNNSQSEFEVIVIDDHSEDEMVEKINRFGITKGLNNLRVVSASGEGKKAAIAQGVREARYDVILQTDADCVVGKEWVSCMQTMLTRNKLALGPVFPNSKSDSLIERFQKIEYALLQLVTAGYANSGKAIMANGANMAFYKEDYLAFAESGEGMDYASGDDQFFLSYLKQKGAIQSIGYCEDPNSIVYTNVPESWTELLEQRTRWLSKMKGIKDRSAGVVGAVLAVVNTFLLLLLIGGIVFSDNISALVLFLGLKMLFEFVVIIKGVNFFNQKTLLFLAPVFTLVYPVFLLVLSLKGKKHYTWKGRSTR